MNRLTSNLTRVNTSVKSPHMQTLVFLYPRGAVVHTVVHHPCLFFAPTSLIDYLRTCRGRTVWPIFVVAVVPNGVETFWKFQSPEWGARTLQTDRQTDDRRTDGRWHIVHEFTFANKTDKRQNRENVPICQSIQSECCLFLLDRRKERHSDCMLW